MICGTGLHHAPPTAVCAVGGAKELGAQMLIDTFPLRKLLLFVCLCVTDDDPMHTFSIRSIMISALATRTSQAPEWAPVDRVRAAPHRAARAHSTRQTNTKHTASPPRQRIREPAPASRREEGDVLREGGGRGAIMAASATRRRHHPSSRPPWAKAARQTTPAYLQRCTYSSARAACSARRLV